MFGYFYFTPSSKTPVKSPHLTDVKMADAYLLKNIGHSVGNYEVIECANGTKITPNNHILWSNHLLKSRFLPIYGLRANWMQSFESRHLHKFAQSPEMCSFVLKWASLIALERLQSCTNIWSNNQWLVLRLWAIFLEQIMAENLNRDTCTSLP